MLLFVLIAVAWLTIAVLVVAICRMAARGDATPAVSAPAAAMALAEGLPAEDQFLRPTADAAHARRSRPRAPLAVPGSSQHSHSVS
jgi:hypothetical protein